MNVRTLTIGLLGALALLAGCAGSPAQAPASPVTLRYEESLQAELTSPAGTRVFLNVLNASLLERPPSAGDLLLVTDGHNGFDTDFAAAFPGQKLMMRAGTLSSGDVAVTGVATTIGASQPPLPEGGPNYIYVVETGGMRVAHFGIIGQDALTPAQLAEVGRVDVALVALSYPFSQVSAESRKAFTLMDQIGPRLVVATQYEEATARYAAGRWVAAYTPSRVIELTPATLPEKTTVVFMGSMAEPVGKLLGLKPLEQVVAP